MSDKKSQKDELKIIIDNALNRILLRKTKKTYQQELNIISKEIEEYIKLGYVSKENHTKEVITKLFEYINQLKLAEKMISDLKIKKGIKLAIKELEKNIYD